MREMLLNLLEKNARMSDKDLAAILGTDEKNVAAEIDRLEDENIIRGYNTVIDWSAFGDEKADAFIEVKVSLGRGVNYDTIAERIYQYPEVTSMYLISGGFDFGVFVTGKTMREVAMFVSEKLATVDGITNTATQFILKNYKERGITIGTSTKDERQVVS